MKEHYEAKQKKKINKKKFNISIPPTHVKGKGFTKKVKKCQGLILIKSILERTYQL